MKPDLTVVAQPMEEMGRKAVELVLHRLELKHEKKEEPVQSIVFSAALKEGDSVRDLAEPEFQRREK